MLRLVCGYSAKQTSNANMRLQYTLGALLLVFQSVVDCDKLASGEQLAQATKLDKKRTFLE